MFDDLINFFDSVFEVFENIWSFLWSLIQFILFAFKTLINLVWQAFVYIFSTDLFDWISDVIDNLSYYLGVPWATAFISMFLIAFLLIFISFIFKVIKWQVSYNATTKKFLKK